MRVASLPFIVLLFIAPNLAIPIPGNNHEFDQLETSRSRPLSDSTDSTSSTTSDGNESSDLDSHIAKQAAKKRVTFDEGRNKIYELPEDNLPLKTFEKGFSSTSAEQGEAISSGSSTAFDYGWSY
ncbi:hypothetical protein FRB94_014557 [Tulasnella sp. JGI-2019a]|nr:hypothetical protein FRB94_014557 [Tulasnella sp. JGI-2019a]